MYGIQPKLPINISKIEGFMCTKTIKENVQQNIKNILLTSPGERIMDINFGVGVRNYLFENFSEVDIEARIEEQISTYMPYLTITRLEAFPVEVDNTLSITLEYYISDVLSEDTLTLSIDPKISV